MRGFLSATAAILLLTGDLVAQASGATQPLQWIPVPPILPPGALIAVVSGDPTGPGRCTVELAMPDGYLMPPHSHPSDEFVEVRAGTLLVGVGDRMDVRKTQPVAVGDTGTAPAGMHHYSIAKGETTVRVTFMGPYTITYVHEYDVPRSPSFPYQY